MENDLKRAGVVKWKEMAELRKILLKTDLKSFHKERCNSIRAVFHHYLLYSICILLYILYLHPEHNFAIALALSRTAMIGFVIKLALARSHQTHFWFFLWFASKTSRFFDSCKFEYFNLKLYCNYFKNTYAIP